MSRLWTGSFHHKCPFRFYGLETHLAEQPESKYRKALCHTHAILLFAKDAFTPPLSPFPISQGFAKAPITSVHLPWEEAPNLLRSYKSQSTSSTHWQKWVENPYIAVTKCPFNQEKDRFALR